MHQGLLIVTYGLLLATAATGAFVFFGFSLFGPPKRRTRASTMTLPKRSIPLNWVVLHVLLALVTMGVFAFAIFDNVDVPTIAYVSFGMYVVTFLTGALFFIQFDARRRPLRRRLLGLHLMMAVATFILITAVMGVSAFPHHVAPPASSPKNSTMWDLVRQHRSELARQEPGKSGLPLP